MRTLITVALLSFGALGAHPALAQDDVARFRIVFKVGGAELATDGAAGEQNKRVTALLGQLLPQWSPGSGAAVMFVTTKSSATDQMLWQRSRFVLAAVRTTSSRSWPIQSEPRQGFIEDVIRASAVSASREVAPTLDVRLFQDVAQGSNVQCPWRIAVRDGSLPPILTPRGPASTLMVTHGGTIPLTRQGALTVTGPSSSYKAVWESERGELCATTSQQNGQLVVPADAPARLHLTAADNKDGRARALLDAPACVTTKDLRTLASNSRGVGDSPGRVPQGTVQPNPQASICSFGVALLADL